MNKQKIDDYVAKVRALETKGLVKEASRNLCLWLSEEAYVSCFDELQHMIDAADVMALNDAFYQVIPFGTGGRRGKMGLGSNRINAQTIAESAQGFVEYLIEFFGKEAVASLGLVITYDVRHHAQEFAHVAAEVFAGNGVKTYFFTGVRATPQISFAIRHLKAIGGAMISASHNPPTDNGIKVYWQTGGQIVPPHDAEIITRVSAVKNISRMPFDEAKAAGRVIMLDNTVDVAYHEAITNLSLGPYRDAHIVFTPLNGCATTSFLPVLRRANFTQIDLVESQMPFDPEFSGAPKQIPNPEVPIAMDAARALAQENGADVAIAADPDADRIGVVTRVSYKTNDYIFLNGNQIGVLLFDYITQELSLQKRLPNNGVLIKTIVTTDLLTAIANAYGIQTIRDLPVGFKYIGDAIETRLVGKTFLFGAEESHGYLYGDYAREKDGAVGALLIAEYASKLKQQHKTLSERLDEIKKEFGYYRELLQAVFYPGMDGMKKMQAIMTRLRENTPTAFAEQKIHLVFDQLEKRFFNPETKQTTKAYHGFPDNALVFYFNEEQSMRLVVRPSGTEPKIKFYVAIGKPVGKSASDAELHEVKKEVDAQAHKILEAAVSLAESISEGGNRFDVLG